MTDPRRDPAALGRAFEERMYRPPSRRRMQVEAWTVFVLLVAVLWCLAGGVWLGAKVVVTLARQLMGA